MSAQFYALFLVLCAVILLSCILGYLVDYILAERVFKPRYVAETNRILKELYLVDMDDVGEVYVHNKESELWQGRVEYIRQRIQLCISHARELKILAVDTVPVFVSVGNLWFYARGCAIGAWCIIIDRSMPRRKLHVIDKLLAHEFAHLVTINGHGKEWKKFNKEFYVLLQSSPTNISKLTKP